MEITATSIESRSVASQSVARFLPVLLFLFAGSGCSALIYEIAWYQVLQLALGSTAVSLGILLATFMGGLCIGSIGLPRLNLARHHPLQVYAALEFGIGVLGVVVTLAMPLISRVYIAGARARHAGHVAARRRGRRLHAAVDHPDGRVAARHRARHRSHAARRLLVGLLYGGNTAGAVFGCLLAGFYLLRIYNMATAAFVAAAINLLVAVVSFVLARGIAPAPAGAPAAEPRHPRH